MTAVESIAAVVLCGTVVALWLFNITQYNRLKDLENRFEQLSERVGRLDERLCMNEQQAQNQNGRKFRTMFG